MKNYKFDYMKDFIFNKQASTELYRKWFLIEKRNPEEYFDREQILDLQRTIINQTENIIDFYCNQEYSAFRGDFPILYINNKEFKKITVDLLIIKNSIECLNVPGCIAEEQTLKDAFNKIILSIIQCANVRFKNSMWFTNRVFPMHTYWNFDSISSEEYMKELREEGWTKEFNCPFHTVLLKEFNPVTYSIPHNETISGSLRFAFKRYQFLMDGSTYHQMYP